MSDHELYELKAIADSVLLPIGFNVTAEESHPDVFGSYYCIYSRADVDIRYVWDGKDGVGFMEIRPIGERAWKVFSSYIAEGNREVMTQLARTAWPGEVEDAVNQRLAD